MRTLCRLVVCGRPIALAMEAPGGLRGCEGALARFCAPEPIGAGAQYLCGGCKQRVPITRRFSLAALPRVLVLHLNRFAVRANGSLAKNAAPVAFPLQLDVTASSLRPHRRPHRATRELSCTNRVAQSDHLITCAFTLGRGSPLLLTQLQR